MLEVKDHIYVVCVFTTHKQCHIETSHSHLPCSLVTSLSQNPFYCQYLPWEENIKTDIIKCILNYVTSYDVSHLVSYTWLRWEGLLLAVRQVRHLRAPHLQAPLNRARARTYTVFSVADGQDRPLSGCLGFGEYCGGGWVESKHRQGLDWLWDAWLSSHRWERASARNSRLQRWAGGKAVGDGWDREVIIYWLLSYSLLMSEEIKP